MNQYFKLKTWLPVFFSLFFILACSSDDAAPEEEVVEQEEELPVAVDDFKETEENTPLTFGDLMENDTVFDFARITNLDTQSTEGGSLVDNRDGTFTYTPPTDFLGEDDFNYTICDNKNPRNCSSATVTVTIVAADPVAVNDIYQTTEEQPLIINSYLDNDDLTDNATLSTVDFSASNSTVSIQDDGSLLYIPNAGFDGIDTFTYTICDDDEIPTCATATITVEVIDEGQPVANDDIVAARQNETTTLNSLLLNDDLTDDATITSVLTEGVMGTVTLNDNNTITYDPPSGFIGQEVFYYDLCDDDSNPACATAMVTVEVVDPIVFNIPTGLQEYYTDVIFSTNTDLNFRQLSELTIAKHTRILSYGERHQYLYDADEDLDNSNNVILMYSGESRDEREYASPTNSYSPQTFNTEHVFPQSRLSTENAVTDLHHLRSTDEDVNSLRLNYPFVDGSGTYKKIGQTWFPGDEWKGDVARMVLYLNIRYGEDYEKVGSLDLFLKWNAEDPVSEFEKQRNRVITEAQGVRNPFIDNPYLINLLWGGPEAENTWD